RLNHGDEEDIAGAQVALVPKQGTCRVRSARLAFQGRALSLTKPAKSCNSVISKSDTAQKFNPPSTQCAAWYPLREVVRTAASWASRSSAEGERKAKARPATARPAPINSAAAASQVGRRPERTTGLSATRKDDWMRSARAGGASCRSDPLDKTVRSSRWTASSRAQFP